MRNQVQINQHTQNHHPQKASKCGMGGCAVWGASLSSRKPGGPHDSDEASHAERWEGIGKRETSWHWYCGWRLPLKSRLSSISSKNHHWVTRIMGCEWSALANDISWFASCNYRSVKNFNSSEWIEHSLICIHCIFPPPKPWCPLSPREIGKAWSKKCIAMENISGCSFPQRKTEWWWQEVELAF